MNAIRELVSGASKSSEENRESKIENSKFDLSTLNPAKGRGSNGALRSQPSTSLHVSLLTGGGDKPYALGMATALTSAGITVDFIGSDELNVQEVINDPLVRFLNLRGDQSPTANPVAKVQRVLMYYARLLAYARTAKPKLFHL